MNDGINMQISAFVDGELPQNEAELLLRRLSQDAELRQQVAEYLAMGRVIRGERFIPGLSTLRERISSSLDDTALEQELDVADTARPRFGRPLAGVAIAATVALAALLGLQQMTAVQELDPAVPVDAVANSTDTAYTVPGQEDDLLRDYYLRHSASSSYFGANSINARLVTLQLREDVIFETDEMEQNLLEEDVAEDGESELETETEEVTAAP
jgi:sigma-E factor negative regulatory protein RseA